MPIVAANGINIAYDEVGDAKAPVILLIMGLGTQMIAWPEAFCLAIAQRGFRVVRFDNRDIGLSTKFETVPRSTSPPPLQEPWLRNRSTPPTQSTTWRRMP